MRARPEDRYRTCAPRVPLEAAARLFGNPQHYDEQAAQWDGDWVEIDTGRRLRPGIFVAQVVGKSMEPGIPDGSYCLFSSPVVGTRQGTTVLVQLRDDADPETGERYTVKKYESAKTVADDGTWRHLKVTLKPSNPAFEPIQLTCEDESNVQVIAELLEVLG